MPPRKRAPQGGRMKVCKGCGSPHPMSKKKCQCGGSAFTDFFKNVGNKIKDTAVDFGNKVKDTATTVYNKALVPAHDFVKRNRIISRTLGVLPNTAAKIAGVGVGALGYGRRQAGQSGGMMYAPLTMAKGVRKPVLTMAGAGRTPRIGSHISM